MTTHRLEILPSLSAPYRRPRIRTLARQRRDLLKRMEDAGLVLPRTEWEDSDPNDIDPVAAFFRPWALT